MSGDPEGLEHHEHAQRVHERAALRHLGAADYWDRRGDPERAALERRNAVIEYAAAELEADRAALERRRSGAG